MVKKILDLECDFLVLCGIFFAIRLIYTKEIYIQVEGYPINTLTLLISTIIYVGIYRQLEKQIEYKDQKYPNKGKGS
jgi:hypothetical protein